MSNPLRILRTLDQHLTLPAEITLFGRSALALGYAQAPANFHNTQDVDGILPLDWLRPSQKPRLSSRLNGAIKEVQPGTFAGLTNGKAASFRMHYE